MLTPKILDVEALDNYKIEWEHGQDIAPHELSVIA
jgi:hypothetical protein